MSIDLSQNWPIEYQMTDNSFFTKYMATGTTLQLGNVTKLNEISNNNLTNNWVDNTTFYNNIISDGLPNFSKQYFMDVHQMCFDIKSERLIVRYFNAPIPGVNNLEYFPTQNDFPNPPSIIEIHESYSYCVWFIDPWNPNGF